MIDTAQCGQGSDFGGGRSQGSPYGFSGGDALIPASGHCFNVAITAHELGHAFGLEHDFRSGAYIMSYGPGQNELAPCAANWIDVHYYFNPPKTAFNHAMEIKMLPPLAELPNSIRLRFEVNSRDGIHQTQLLTRATDKDPSPNKFKLLTCKQIDGNSSTA